MPSFLLEPTDVLFFRDGIPMSAGQGRGAGCRLPFPSTLHEAIRASLFAKHGRKDCGASFRPKDAPRKGGWLGKGKSVSSTGSKEYQSLAITGPLPWHDKHGLLLPVPLDVAQAEGGKRLRRLQLLAVPAPEPGRPACLPVAITPPDKQGVLRGWWTIAQYLSYLRGEETGDFAPLPDDSLWQSEHRIGLEIDPARSAAAEGQLFAGTYLRMHPDVRFGFSATLKSPGEGEVRALEDLDWLLLGGDRRLARLWKRDEDGFAALRTPPETPDAGNGPVLLKWALVTPAIFAHGSTPGWCVDTGSSGRPRGDVCLPLPGRAKLVSWCLGKPQTVTGWDLLKSEAKPTQLAVPAGSVYYFLCENRATAAALAAKLHWQPRSDRYGEKGCGYGLCSFAVKFHPTSPPLVL